MDGLVGPLGIQGKEMKIIFLDIDGPMIPSSMLLHDRMASFNRKFPVTTIAVLNKLCEVSGAKVVFNTTHNIPMDGVADIEYALMEHGVKSEYLFWNDLKTEYPSLPRDEAVKSWLRRHQEVEEWVALDDARFTEDERLIWVDPDTGITLQHLFDATKILGGTPPVILM